MKHITLSLQLLAGGLHAQDVIHPMFGSIFAEGTFSPGEWENAPTVNVPLGTSNACQVGVVVDDWGIYLGFMGHMESDQRFPEVLLDMGHEQGTDWDSNDHWFHVSATSCHHLGEYGVYDDCSPLPEDWSAHPGFTLTPPATDSVEIAIPWWFLGLSPQPGDTIGFAVLLTNTINAWELWPVGASQLDPFSWGHLVFPGATAIGEAHDAVSLSIQPNPATDQLTVRYRNTVPGTISLVDPLGRMIWQSNTPAQGVQQIPIAELRPGTYFVRMESDAGTLNRKVIKH